MTTLSVVVIGRNEGLRLERCLASVRTMEGVTPLELIYVDSASTDGSPELAARMDARVLLLGLAGATAARARNCGWKAATGQAILFLDGDTVLHPRFPQLALEALYGRPMRAAVWGHRRESNPGQSVYTRVLDLDWVYPTGDSASFGGDVLIRREVLETVQGYDDALIAGEEPEMSRRIRALGWHIEHIDAPMTTHDLAITRFGPYWRRGVRSGYALAQVAARFRATDDPFWSDEVRRNYLRGTFWTLSPLVMTEVCVYARSLWPIGLWVLLLLGLATRISLTHRWKGARWFSLLLFGVHCHLVQVPFLCGQIKYFLDRRRGHSRALIEYKDVP